MMAKLGKEVFPDVEILNCGKGAQRGVIDLLNG